MSRPPVPLFDSPSSSPLHAPPPASVASSSSPYSVSQLSAALSSACSLPHFDSIRDVQPSGSSLSFRCYFYNWSRISSSPLFFLFLHGGGQTSLSAAPLIQSFRRYDSTSQPFDYPFLAIDFRSHGGSTGSAAQLDSDTLVSDTRSVLAEIAADGLLPSVVLVGHSLGAAIAVRLSAAMFASATFSSCPKFPVCGLICIDLVEGSAIASLDFIRSSVSSRPNQFDSLESAVDWAIRSGAIHRLESAAISIPSQLEQVQPEAAGGAAVYRWRTDLLSSSSHWEGWFTGLSDLYLSQPCPKLLILVSADRLDKPLLIAQMQGKIQIQLMKDSSHQIMEDRPDETARSLRDFLQRHQIVKRIQQIKEIDKLNQNGLFAKPPNSGASGANKAQ